MARRPAAIMFTDIADYTAMAQADEAGALGLVKEQERLVRPLLEVHRGRMVKSMGDGLLFEFPEALDAIACGVELQLRAHERNAQKDSPPLRLRVGIHLGEVQRRGTDILGNAVNVASRIEPLAEPEGVCLSVQVYEEVHTKVPFQWEKLGPKVLKGIPDAVEVYRVVFPWSRESVSTGLSAIPRIAVLPLANISPDPNDEYLADGLTEETISVLSQIQGWRVISHTSVNQYKHTTKTIAQIGAELGVDSVLEGSVRKSGDQVRISVQLIDTHTDDHRWAQTYDRKLENVFAVQADVAEQTSRALKVELLRPVADRLKARTMGNPESYLACLKGRNMMSYRRGADLMGAKKQFERAIELDPSNAVAYVDLAHAITFLAYLRDEYAEEFEQRKILVEKALSLDDHLAEAHTELGDVRRFETDFAGAEEEYRIALSISPSFYGAHHEYALLLMDLGRTEQALQEITLAIEANPHAPESVHMRAQLFTFLGRIGEADADLARLAALDPDGELYHQDLMSRAEAVSDTEGILKELDWFLQSNASLLERLSCEASRFLLTGERDKARSVYEKIRESPYDSGRKAKILACLSPYLGDLDECFHWIDEMIRLHTLEFLIWRLDPAYTNVRADPRYGDLVKRLKAE